MDVLGWLALCLRLNSLLFETFLKSFLIIYASYMQEKLLLYYEFNWFFSFFHKATTFLKIKYKRKRFSQFSTESVKKEARKRTNRLKFQFIYIDKKKTKNLIQCTFSSVVMPPNFIYFD